MRNYHVLLASTAAALVAGLSANAQSLFNAQGAINPVAYAAEAYAWDRASVNRRLGPTFEQLNPGAVDDRPTLYKPASKARTSGYVRTNPYELGGTPAKDGDYWSESGQVGYVPDDLATDPGLDRIQVYAYYDKVFAISPRLDWASGTPHPEPQTREPFYAKLNGEAPKQPIAMVRNYGLTDNEALVLYRDGLLAVAGTQTSRGANERPYPGLVFPANKVPTALALTTENEFALVTIWDTDTQKGQLAVVALEGKYIPFHTWPYMGMPNQGSFSAFKLLGYVDLPFATPSAVAAASNGWWNGPSQTDNRVLSQVNLALDWARNAVYTTENLMWNKVVAENGYAIVASKLENKVAVVDLTPIFNRVRESYLSSGDSFRATLANRGDAPTQFPQTFDVAPTTKPNVIWQASYTKPTAVLAGIHIDRWSKDRLKAYVATEDGTLHILDASGLMYRNTWEKKGSLRQLGSFKVGANPVAMCFARRGNKNLPLVPSTSNSGLCDPENNVFWVACRGSREIVECNTWEGQGVVVRRIRDRRMGDPVAISSAVRGPIITVADFSGKKILSFRTQGINDLRNNVYYGCGANGTDSFEFAGELPLQGTPFLVGSSNVN